MSAAPIITGAPNSSAAELRRLLELSLTGILPMFYPGKNLFCYRLKQTPAGLVKEGISHRYTLITLLGLRRAVAAGFDSPIDRTAVLFKLAKETSWINNVGDLGLYLWLCALDCPEYLPSLFSQFNLQQALNIFPDACARRTMEIAWFLSGISHLKLAAISGIPELTDLAVRAARLLEANCGPQGLFGHQAARGMTGTLRGRIGTFADQVYPIYALTRFAQAFGHAKALERAVECGESICRLQESLGQWCWHYDSRTGRVTSQYPVYSVHQDAMAPLALLPLGEVASRDFMPETFKGLAWISGNNELGVDLRDFSTGLVWRSLYQSKAKAYANELLSFARLPSSFGGLKIRYEDRPYHLGWVLYALSGYGNHTSRPYQRS